MTSEIGKIACYQGEDRSVLDQLGEMLYPLLSLGTSFPLGSHSENVDSLLRNGAIRVTRARSELEPSILRHRVETGEKACRARQWTPSYRSGDIIWDLE